MEYMTVIAIAYEINDSVDFTCNIPVTRSNLVLLSF